MADARILPQSSRCYRRNGGGRTDPAHPREVSVTRSGDRGQHGRRQPPQLLLTGSRIGENSWGRGHFR